VCRGSIENSSGSKQEAEQQQQIKRFGSAIPGVRHSGVLWL